MLRPGPAACRARVRPTALPRPSGPAGDGKLAGVGWVGEPSWSTGPGAPGAQASPIPGPGHALSMRQGGGLERWPPCPLTGPRKPKWLGRSPWPLVQLLGTRPRLAPLSGAWTPRLTPPGTEMSPTLTPAHPCPQPLISSPPWPRQSLTPALASSRTRCASCWSGCPGRMTVGALPGAAAGAEGPSPCR